jgi:hypothetical protein
MEFPSLQTPPFNQRTGIHKRPVTDDQFDAATGNCWPVRAFSRTVLGHRRVTTYSVEKLLFGAVAIFQFYRNTAEHPRETRRTAD